MARRFVNRPERLGEAARPRLELHEVPLELNGSLDGDRRQLAGRPLLSIRVPPGAEWRAVRHAQRQRRFDPLPAFHEIEFKLDLMDGTAGIEAAAARLREAAQAGPIEL